MVSKAFPMVFRPVLYGFQWFSMNVWFGVKISICYKIIDTMNDPKSDGGSSPPPPRIFNAEVQDASLATDSIQTCS